MQEALLIVAEHSSQAVAVVSVVAHLREEGQAAVAALISTCEDVDRAPNRGDGQFAGTEPALDLCGAHDQVKSGPVAPIDPTIFHVVHRDTVHHHREVGLVKTPDGDPRISVSTALLGSVNPRG